MKNRYQNVCFTSLEDCYSYVKIQELEIMQLLRQIIVETIPNCTEKLSYNVPYFYGHSRICYLWPASIPWGNVRMTGVQLGFCNGNLLDDSTGYLDKGNRKQVYFKELRSVSDISDKEANIIQTLLLQAMNIDILKSDSKIKKI